jgi:Raf kinase inhibitor-like YbhB/YbcL family protein
MAIKCPHCGHEYDVSLFQFGRGIRCDCGTSVDLQRGHEQPADVWPSLPLSLPGGQPMSFRISSSAFAHGQPIPKRHSGDGEDLSPALAWDGVPAGTVEFALVCDDPDAPTAKPWVHWVIYKLAAELRSLPEGLSAASRLESPVRALQGRNSWPSGRTTGYRGPAPPPGHGVHHYHFKLYALDCELKLNPAVDKDTLVKATDGHVLAQAELVGTYQR